MNLASFWLYREAARVLGAPAATITTRLYHGTSSGTVALTLADDDGERVNLRGLVVVLWRAGLRISEALAQGESDLNRSPGAIPFRRGQGERRELGMVRRGWSSWTYGDNSPRSRGVGLAP
jgi:hypothetical protein